MGHHRFGGSTGVSVLLWLLLLGGADPATSSGPRLERGLEIRGGTAGLLKAAGITVPVEPDRALLVLASRLHGPFAAPVSENGSREIAALLDGSAPAAGVSEHVPALLPPAVWRQVLQRDLPAAQLPAAIILDRPASLLYCGLFALDDETLAFFAGRPDLVASIWKRFAPAFAAYAGGIHVRGGRVQVAGGAPAEQAWSRALDASPARPERFILRLLERGQGRVAQLFEALGGLDPPHLAFALGPSARGLPPLIASAAGFDAVARLPFASWSVVDVPFLLEEVEVTADGRMAPPRDRSFWAKVLPAGGGRPRRDKPGEGEATASWLVGRFAALTPPERRDWLDALLFAQRRVAGAPGRADSEWMDLAASFPAHQMLFLTLEQLGAAGAAEYRAAAEAAAALTRGYEPAQSSLRLAVFQSVVAFLARMARVGTIAPNTALDLAREAFELAPADRLHFAAGFASWFERSLFPRLPPAPAGTTDEARLLDALAGRPPGPSSPVLQWEDHRYRVDLAYPERHRLDAILERLEGKTLDDVTALRHAMARLSETSTPAAGRREAAAAIEAVAALPFDIGDQQLFGFSVGGAFEGLLQCAREVSQRPAGRLTEPEQLRLAEGLEALLADVLVARVYALAMDAEAPLMAGDNPGRRHDFAFGPAGDSGAWRMAGVRAGSGPRGSLLGLDRCLARQALRPTTAGLPAGVPTLTVEDITSVAESVVALNGTRMTDEARDDVAAALARGRSRLSRAARESSVLDDLLASAGVDGIRRRLARLAAEVDPDALFRYVSLSEVLALGQRDAPPIPQPALDQWAPAARLVNGGLGQQMPRRLAWRERGKHPGSGLLGAQLADLQLRVVEELAQRRLPASLAPGILSFAAWDLTMTAKVTEAGDWLPVVRAAQVLSAESFEDYVSGLAAGGPLVRADAEGRPRTP